MTLAQFLDWEATQELRWEFDGIAPVAMTGGTVAHDVIQANLVAILNARLRGGPCRAHGGNLKVEVAGRIRYPEAFIACGPIDPRATVRADPVIVFEILSPSTARIDRFEKMREYWDTPSIRRTVLVEQEGISATSFIRQDGRWTGKMLWTGDLIDLPEVGIELPLDALYDGLDPAALGGAPSSSATPET